jgi:broad-specificity NMP kinase
MFLIGLTGGAATGKSTTSALFKDLGVPVIDADEVARFIIEPGQPAFNEIKMTFGQDVIDANTGKVVSPSEIFREIEIHFTIFFSVSESYCFNESYPRG